MSIVYPYPTLIGRIDVTVDRVRVDGRSLPFTMISKSDHVVALHEIERPDWREASIDLRVGLPDGELGDGPWSEVVCAAVLSERQTNTRFARRLQLDRATRTWTGTIELLRGLHRERVVLDVAAVATVDGVRGRTIGTADDPWVLDLHARVPTRRSEIAIVELDFRDGSDEWLRPFKDAPWVVDATAENPTVYLNTAFEGLAPLLHGSGSIVEKAVSSLVASQIADDAWGALFQASVAELELDEDGTPLLPSGWRGSLLLAMLPEIYPDLAVPDALTEVHKRLEVDGWARLQPLVQFAAGRRAQLAKNLTATARAVARTREDSTS